MWIQRDLLKFLQNHMGQTLPVKILRGPRQVGKTSLLEHLGTHQLILFDDLTVRNFAEANPALFFEQFTGPLILDEATLAPHIFPELKRSILNIVEKWVVSFTGSINFANARSVLCNQIFQNLHRLESISQ